MSQKQTVFYHYTSIDALYSIVSSKTFWLANAKSSNDKTEGSFSIEEFELLLKDAYEKNGESNEILKRIIDSPIDEEETKDLSYFILCLSSKQDNLSHWERYGANKMGICISLKVSCLSGCHNIINRVYGDFFKIFNIYYDMQCIFKKEFDKLKQIALSKEIKERLPIAFENKMYLSVLKTSLLTTLKKTIKNECFSDENELRILVENENLGYLKSIIPSIADLDFEKESCLEMFDSLDIEKTYFAPIRGEIRSLHHLCLKDIWGSDLIPEIMLGPNCPQSKDELRYFLAENGLKDTKITKSKIPIR